MAHVMDPSSISTLTDSQEITLSLLAIVSGTLSTIGSATISYKVLSNFGRAGPYDRLLLGLSFGDILSSLTLMCTPFMLPEDSSQRIWARGTDVTCTMLGFFTQVCFAPLIYNGCLSIYYLLTVRFGVKRAEFSRRWEPWLHIVTLTYFLGTASAGVFMNVYVELDIGQGCWVGPFPAGCEDTVETCYGEIIAWVFGGGPGLATVLVVIVNNVIIYRHVKRVLGPSSGGSVGNGQEVPTNTRTLRHRFHLQEVRTQGLFFVASFFVCFSAQFFLRVFEAMRIDSSDEARIYWLLVLDSLLRPLQGFVNMFVYTRPNYVRVRAAYPEKNTIWVIRTACLESDMPPRLPFKGPSDRNSLSDNFRDEIAILSKQKGTFRPSLPAVVEAMIERDSTIVSQQSEVEEGGRAANEMAKTNPISTPQKNSSPPLQKKK